MAVTQQQVELFMSQRKSGKSQVAAAAKAGLSERTGRRIERGERQRQPRDWRTRTDPFAEHWEDVAEQLAAQPHLQALTLLEWLQERHPDQYPDHLLRTLQRRVKQWRALHGPEKEVMFLQTHEPGQRGLSDFTQLKQVVITVAGVALVHLLYHFRLAFSGWSYVRVVCGGESYTALAEGLAGALEALGGVPVEHRTDSLSAAYRNLNHDERDDVTERYAALCEHYGLKPTRNNRGRGHENGSVESPHGHIKRRLGQRLALRGSNDFASIDAYQIFLDSVAAQSNRRHAERIKAEQATLAPLPQQSGITYTQAMVRVTRTSTFTLKRVVYSVPSRLIGERLGVHIFDDRLELFVGQTAVLTLKRLRSGAARKRQIDYRHLIGWLAQKPRALAGLAFRDQLLPDDNWRRIYQHLSTSGCPMQASKDVVATLKLAADQDMAEPIGQWWSDALCCGKTPTRMQIAQRFTAPRPPVAGPDCQQHSLADYDHLLMAQSA